jgi:hypothetical protein
VVIEGGGAHTCMQAQGITCLWVKYNLIRPSPQVAPLWMPLGVHCPIAVGTIAPCNIPKHVHTQPSCYQLAHSQPLFPHIQSYTPSS